MASLQLDWVKCGKGVWCGLNSVNLSHANLDDFEGVYLIWHGGVAPRVVYVGKGVIRQRLLEHRSDGMIQHYGSLGLFVTWARVEVRDRDGVEAHLIAKWRPKVNVAQPSADPIEVNSPF